MAQKSIEELKNLWEVEKEEYKSVEIGSGVQKFVKEVFKCSELFNLKEGKLSTKDVLRKNEFLEEARKKGRRADIVIFIDGDIIIPVEIEKHGNIKAGEKQIFDYQIDWVKKFGLLTDGQLWQFYNNRYLEKTFKIEDIFNNPDLFITFWKEYTTPEYYYKSFFEKKGQLELELFPPPTIDDVREDFFMDITKLIANFESKLNLKGYLFQEANITKRQKKAIEITYAYLIQFILYKVLVDNSFADFEQDWEDRFKSIDKAIKAEIFGEVLTKIKGISNKISDKIYKNFNEEQRFINEKLKEIESKPITEIGDVSVWLDILLFISRYNFANVQNEIFGYVYENYLKELYEDKNKGQYFTDPAVVDFMLDEVGYTKKEIKALYKSRNLDQLSLVDPSCGSGTFLYNAVDRIIETLFEEGRRDSAKIIEELINQHIFGLDIAEFPLYLAEMNILMRMLPIIIDEEYNNPVEKKIKVFKTQDSIAEFCHLNIDATGISQENMQGELFSTELLQLESFIRDEDNLKDLKDSLFPPRKRFDFVVGNPPYIGYNECCAQGLLFTQLIKAKKLKMNSVFGVNLNTAPNHRKPYSPKPNLYSFFVVLGLALLKPNCKLCYIIPQTLLTANDLDVLRYHLAKYTTINKIITFEGQLFIGRGIKQTKPIATSSLIIICSKKKPDKDHIVEVINYIDNKETEFKNLFNKSEHVKVNFKQEELLNRFVNWNFIKYDETYQNLLNEYNKSISIDQYRRTLKYYDLIRFDKGLVFKRGDIRNDGGDFQLIDSSETYSPTYTNTFIDEKNLTFPSGAQGIEVYYLKYKIVWSYTRSKYYFSDKKIMIGSNWLIISSNHKDELLFFFSIISSSLNKLVLERYSKINTEKIMILSIKTIKEFLKVPIIDDENACIKNEIINQMNEILELENKKLSDYIETKEISMQKFDNCKIINDKLVLAYKNNNVTVEIKDKIALVKQILTEMFNPLIINEPPIKLRELRNIPIIDVEQQKRIQDYINDLVYALYFKIKLPFLGFENKEKIKEICKKNQFYSYLSAQGTL